MSKESPRSEEVDLGQLFHLICNLFDRLFKFIGFVFKSIFSVIIFILKALLDNYKLIAISMIVAAAIGYGLEKNKKPVYFSSMLVKPYFDSKFQLITNINYYNALIENQDYKQLRNLFGIDEAASVSLVQFEINLGPETENDKIIQYGKFIRAVDSVRAQDISYEDFLEDRSIYSGEVFEISIQSKKKDIFKSLEEGLNSTFINSFSLKQKKKRDSLIGLSRARIQRDLIQVDSLKRMYIDVIQKEASSNGNSPLSYKEGGMTLVQERVQTREYELLAKELELRSELTELDAQQVEEDVYFDILSSFQEVGSRYISSFNKYTIVFPVLVFVLLCLCYIILNIIRFVSTYEE